MYLKASYTVEAAFIMGICLLVIMVCLILGFTIYHETIEYMDATVVEDFDIVERFRQIHMGKDFVGGLIQN